MLCLEHSIKFPRGSMTYTPLYTSATSIYTKTGLTSAEVDLSTYDELIQDAELELEALTGRKFTSGNTKTDILNGPKKDILGYSGQEAVTITLSEYPIQSITQFLILNIDGSTNTTYGTLTTVQIAAGTYYTTDYWIETQEDPLTHLVVPYGKVHLKTDTFPVGTANISVTYTYGYTTVPVNVRDLATCLAGIRAWIRFLGGSYNRLNSYSIPQQSVDKGDFYVRGMQNIQNLQDEANRLLDRIGRRPSRLMFSSSGDR